VSKVERFERRIDVVELYDWLTILEIKPLGFFRKIGWFVEPQNQTNLPALPIDGEVKEHENGVLQQLAWQGEVREVLLEGISVEDYLEVERTVRNIYSPLNEPGSSLKNREAIYEAFAYAIRRLPNLNPSDIYQHLIYRLYLREYSKTQADRSWVRAGGEALELFVERHYGPILQPESIEIKALLSAPAKEEALREMGIHGRVGNSKLDVVLYGAHGERKIIFGGVHVKASLAERVVDDVPCSEAMMEAGIVSYLFTLDSKSFPPPAGDLVNRGEFGTPNQPSDKRRYVEEHGSFDACFSYNLRTVPSRAPTPSGKAIFVASFKPEEDLFPKFVVESWEQFKRS